MNSNGVARRAKGDMRLLETRVDVDAVLRDREGLNMGSRTGLSEGETLDSDSETDTEYSVSEEE
jgi:hypothetical protein